MACFFLQACNDNNNETLQYKLTIDSLQRELVDAKAELDQLRSTRKQPVDSSNISHYDKHIVDIFIQRYGKSEAMVRLKLMEKAYVSENMKMDLFQKWRNFLARHGE
ncbi:hypothetical protein SAMN04488055_5424 [Chitinophaga niabensis]|uniref:Uncharacterized protein n=2 Tax=Chitinophaga niabensis TaxID=536979 RepID=A0A1N6KAX2_9BACT|nr:hypothetical protein SAMN04488055_5424 [Chitinophaga niabensis]